MVQEYSLHDNTVYIKSITSLNKYRKNSFTVTQMTFINNPNKEPLKLSAFHDLQPTQAYKSLNFFQVDQILLLSKQKL